MFKENSKKSSSYKKIKVFISYCTQDINNFQIPRVVDFLEFQTDTIEKVYYWIQDTKGGQDFDDFMREKINTSDFVLFFFSEILKITLKTYIIFKFKSIIQKNQNII